MKSVHDGNVGWKVCGRIVGQGHARMTLLLVCGCLLFSGCTAMQRFAYNSKVSLYLSTNPNVPEKTSEALHIRELIKGMNKEEVTLSLGDPTKKEWATFDAKEETWVYWHTESPQYGDNVVTPENPLRLAFTNTPKGFILYAWKVQDKSAKSTTNALPDIAVASNQSPVKKNAATPDVLLPKIYSKKNDSSGDGRWPVLTLEGISKQGGKAWALINNNLISVGEKVEGAVVVSIFDDGVVLNCNGESRLLKQEAK
jgi:outer membrane protein assembly factor BamE (lipoprotein component of BamABCDE complex)